MPARAGAALNASPKPPAADQGDSLTDALPHGTAASAGRSYQVVQMLGKGAFGQVFKAQDVTTEEVVAIKVLKRANCNRYVTTELLNHSRLQHPNVIGFRRVWLSPNSINVVMELANAGSVFDYVNKCGGRLAEEVARPFFQQLMLAIDYCHKVGVANRDIKLENLLLHQAEPNGQLQVKLCDFGYSKSMETGPQTAVGTLYYMSPEVLRNGVMAQQQRYDAAAADIWSCGVALYAMLVGGYPFAVGRSADKSALSHALHQMHTQDFPLPDHLSDSCKALLLGLLQPDRQQRLTMQAIRADPWFRVGLMPGVFERNNEYAAAGRCAAQSDAEIRLLMDAVHNGHLVAAAP